MDGSGEGGSKSMGGICGRLEYEDSWIMRVEFRVAGASPFEARLSFIGGVKSESESISDSSEIDSLMSERTSCRMVGSSYSRRNFV